MRRSGNRMTRAWFSPFPLVDRGTDEARAALGNLDKEINYLDILTQELKKRRREAQPESDFDRDAYSTYLDIIDDQRRAESELARLLDERLKVVLLADFAYDTEKRGEHFPHPSIEAHTVEHIQNQKERLIAVSTVAFFGSAVTFSTVFSATRGSIGLMSLAWAAFSVSFSLCVWEQWINPQTPSFTVVAYPGRRVIRFWTIFLAAFASFVGIILMATTLVLLGLEKDGSVSTIGTSVNTYIGGGLSLLPVVLGFFVGCVNMIRNGLWRARIRAKFRSATML